MMTEQYEEVSLEVPRAYTDAVCNYIIDNLSAGMVLEDEEDSDVIGIKFYIADENDSDGLDGLKEYLKALVEDGMPSLPEINSRMIANANWEEQYRLSVTPIWITDDVLIRPPWDESPVKPKYEIIIEPRMAFGTGRHETTRSCLKAIAGSLKSGSTFLDLGCGSGILSILAIKMGAVSAKAIDYDKLAVDNSIENFKTNSVADKCQALYGSIELCADDKPYDYVVVNIIKKTIMSMLPRLKELTIPSSFLVLAGLKESDREDITRELAAIGLTDFDLIKDNEWTSFLIRR